MNNRIFQSFRKNTGKFVGLVLAAALLAGCGAQGGNSSSAVSSAESGDTSSMTAENVQEGMKAGWNLGNDLDCIDNQKSGDAAHYESLWGNKPVTLSSIEALKDEGFGAVRVPVTWADHIGDDGTIDEAWLERVREVVDYVIDSGMYCILDAHHDTGENARINADSASLDENKEKLTSLWTQIADEFRDYDSHLVFEGFNEILDSGNHWTDPDNSCYDTVNELNQAFVDAVRKTGGNNAERVLLCDAYASGFNADILGNFELPDDSAKDRLMVDIHYYGTDTNPELCKCLEECAREFILTNKLANKAVIFNRQSEIPIPELKNSIGLCFSSPPYFDYEIYRGENTSTTLYPQYEDWVDRYSCESKAQEILFAVRQHKLKLCKEELRQYISDGAFYYLSDKCIIGWHKSWKEFFKKEGEQDGQDHQ